MLTMLYVRAQIENVHKEFLADVVVWDCYRAEVAISARVNTVWNCHRAEIASQYV